MSKVLAVLLELKECAEYWSEYAVPIGIHERIDEAIAELLAKPQKNRLIEVYSDLLKSLIENDGAGLKELKAFDLETYNKLKDIFGARPDIYQFRSKLIDDKDWGHWILCNKTSYEGYKNNPTFQQWTYQVRKPRVRPERTELNQKSFRGLELSGDSYPQDPVAWLLSSKDSSYSELRKTEPEGTDMYLYQIKPLYTSLPKREPLSEDAIKAIVNQLPTAVDLGTGIEFCRIIEKAHGIGNER